MPFLGANDTRHVGLPAAERAVQTTINCPERTNFVTPKFMAPILARWPAVNLMVYRGSVQFWPLPTGSRRVRVSVPV